MPAVANYISKAAPTDNYPVVHDVDMLGGYRIVSDLIARDGIVSNQRKFGMLVFVESDSHYYRLLIGLTNLDWEDLGDSLGGSTGLTPTSDIKTANYTANANELVLCDTSLGSFTLTLPITPTNGMRVAILDVANSFSETNPLIIDPGTNQIIGEVDTFSITIARSSITFICIDNAGVFGWHILDSIPNIDYSNKGFSSYRAYALPSVVPTIVNGRIVIPSVNYNINNCYNTTTGIFTARESGYYFVSWQFYFSASTNVVNVHVNNVLYRSIGSYGESAYSGNGFDVVYLNTNDTIDLRVQAGTLSNTSSSISYMAVTQISSVANIRGVANLDYNLVETDTNTRWINGKPIYRKVVLFGSLVNSTAKTVAHGITGIERVINYQMTYTLSGNFFALNAYEGTRQVLYIRPTDIYYSNTESLAGATDAIVVIEYTKV
jgi:hypothetical protein